VSVSGETKQKGGVRASPFNMGIYIYLLKWLSCCWSFLFCSW